MELTRNKTNGHITRGLICLLIVFSASFLRGQNATVTFYSPQDRVIEQLRNGLVPKGETSFSGWLFDGRQKLAKLQRGRFITLNFLAGPHSFAASHRSKSPQSKTLALDLTPNSHTCVRLRMRYTSAMVAPVYMVEAELAEVACTPNAEVAKTKQLDPKEVEQALRGAIVSSTAFPN